MHARISDAAYTLLFEINRTFVYIYTFFVVLSWLIHLDSDVTSTYIMNYEACYKSQVKLDSNNIKVYLGRWEKISLPIL